MGSLYRFYKDRQAGAVTTPTSVESDRPPCEHRLVDVNRGCVCVTDLQFRGRRPNQTDRDSGATGHDAGKVGDLITGRCGGRWGPGSLEAHLETAGSAGLSRPLQALVRRHCASRCYAVSFDSLGPN